MSHKKSVVSESSRLREAAAINSWCKKAAKSTMSSDDLRKSFWRMIAEKRNTK